MQGQRPLETIYNSTEKNHPHPIQNLWDLGSNSTNFTI